MKCHGNTLPALHVVRGGVVDAVANLLPPRVLLVQLIPLLVQVVEVPLLAQEVHLPLVLARREHLSLEIEVDRDVVLQDGLLHVRTLRDVRLAAFRIHDQRRRRLLRRIRARLRLRLRHRARLRLRVAPRAGAGFSRARGVASHAERRGPPRAVVVEARKTRLSSTRRVQTAPPAGAGAKVSPPAGRFLFAAALAILRDEAKASPRPAVFARFRHRPGEARQRFARILPRGSARPARRGVQIRSLDQLRPDRRQQVALDLVLPVRKPKPSTFSRSHASRSGLSNPSNTSFFLTRL